MDNIKQLTKSLNSLRKSGYPNAINFTLKVDNLIISYILFAFNGCIKRPH